MHRVRTPPPSGRFAAVATLQGPSASVVADIRDATPKAVRPMTVALAGESDAAGFVVVPVRDAQIVVRTLSLRPAGATTQGAPPEPITPDLLPAVVCCLALMLWMALRRAR